MNRYDPRMVQNDRGDFVNVFDVIRLLWALYEDNPTKGLADALRDFGEVPD